MLKIPEDSSIFVCYLCEKEFNSVKLLNIHMTTHAADYNAEDDEATKDLNSYYTKNPAVMAENKNKRKKLSLQKIGPAFPPKISVDSITSKRKIRKPKEILTGNSNINEAKDPILIKKASNSETNLNIAMKIKRLVLLRENESKKKNSNGVGSERKSYSSKSSLINGPTIMNCEPDGFICPRSQMQFYDNTNEESSSKVIQNIGNDLLREGSASTSSKVKGKVLEAYRKRKIGPGRPPAVDRQKPSLDDISALMIDGQEASGIKIETAQKSSKFCILCNDSFPSHTHLKSHVKEVHQDLKKPITCPYCPLVCEKREDLYGHLASEHGDFMKGLYCEMCNKVFTRTDSLRSHMVRFHGGGGGTTCTICNKNFPSRAQCKTHYRSHTGERPFKCTLCIKGFIQKVHLQTHLRTMHNIIEELCFEGNCRWCKKHLANRDDAMVHLAKDHKLSLHQCKSEIKLMEVNLNERLDNIDTSHSSVVKVVSPNMTYRNLLVQNPKTQDSFRKPLLPNKKSKKKHPVPFSLDSKVMNPNDDVMFSPVDYMDKSDEGQMLELLETESIDIKEDSMEDESLISSGIDASSSNVQYYNLPVVIDGDNQIDYADDYYEIQDDNRKVVLAESIDEMDTSGTTVEMLSM